MMRRAVRRVVYGRTETGRDVDFFGGEAVSVPAAQCLEIDLASQGETEEEALANLREALELHFEPPVATHPRLDRRF